MNVFFNLIKLLYYIIDNYNITKLKIFFLYKLYIIIKFNNLNYLQNKNEIKIKKKKMKIFFFLYLKLTFFVV
jgi:hypothetical protein